MGVYWGKVLEVYLGEGMVRKILSSIYLTVEHVTTPAYNLSTTFTKYLQYFTHSNKRQFKNISTIATPYRYNLSQKDQA